MATGFPIDAIFRLDHDGVWRRVRAGRVEPGDRLLLIGLRGDELCKLRTFTAGEPGVTILPPASQPAGLPTWDDLLLAAAEREDSAGALDLLGGAGPGDGPVTPLEEHKRLWSALDRLCRRGEGDGPEAEAVRDSMDATWKRMTTVDMEKFRRWVRELEEGDCTSMDTGA